MASYSLAFKASVEKDFVSIPKTILPRIVARIEQLKSDPFPNQSRKLQSTRKAKSFEGRRVSGRVRSRYRRVIDHHPLCSPSARGLSTS